MAQENFQQPNNIIDAQIVMNSNILNLDAKKEIHINTKDNLNIGTEGPAYINTGEKGLHLSSRGKICIGDTSDGACPNIPVVKSDILIIKLEAILDQLIQFTSVVYPLTIGGAGEYAGMSPENGKNSRGITRELEKIKSSLKEIESNQVYIK